MSSRVIRIATRASPLALAQARIVVEALRRRHGLDERDLELVRITTSGDAARHRRLSEIGGKGLFTKEIEEALVSGAADLAVHSMKDMETRLPDGLAVAALAEREDPRDVLVSVTGARTVSALPAGAVLGTSSLRRAALVRALRPDIVIVPLRGNVETRLGRVAKGGIDATLLARAGLNRLGIEPANASPLDIDEVLPAVAQGAIGIETRADDRRMRELVEPLDHQPTRLAVTAERALLAALDGSCRTPIAALATLEAGAIRLRALVARPDGSTVHRVDVSGPEDDAAALGRSAGSRLLSLAGPGFLDI
jgi:hydroxymethylbilane synthase